MSERSEHVTERSEDNSQSYALAYEWATGGRS